MSNIKILGGSTNITFQDVLCSHRQYAASGEFVVQPQMAGKILRLCIGFTETGKCLAFKFSNLRYHPLCGCVWGRPKATWWLHQAGGTFLVHFPGWVLLPTSFRKCPRSLQLVLLPLLTDCSQGSYLHSESICQCCPQSFVRVLSYPQDSTIALNTNLFFWFQYGLYWCASHQKLSLPDWWYSNLSSYWWLSLKSKTSLKVVTSERSKC